MVRYFNKSMNEERLKLQLIFSVFFNISIKLSLMCCSLNSSVYFPNSRKDLGSKIVFFQLFLF